MRRAETRHGFCEFSPKKLGETKKVSPSLTIDCRGFTLGRMASSGLEPLPPSAPTNEESTVMVVHVPATVHAVDAMAHRTEAEEAARKRQRDYQSKSLRKKKEDLTTVALVLGYHFLRASWT